jgi:outer membrane protein assembly factor BamA
MANDSIVNSYKWIYYKYPLFSVFGNIGYNPDDGVYLGPTFKIITHGFRKSPYKSFHQFKGLYAFSTKATRITYNNEFIGVFGRNTDITTEIDYKGPNNTTNFFGYGMNSFYDKTKTGKFKFYRIRYDLGDISLQLRHRFSNKVMLSVGPTFQFYSYDSTDQFNKARNVELNILSGLNQGVFDKRQSYLGAKLDLSVDTRNNPVLPGKGISWNTSFRYLSGNKGKSYKSVSQLYSEFSFYVSLVKDWLVWANRTGAGVTIADGMNFEFYQAQYLGSKEDLRGYRKERFAGKSKIFNQTELRWKLANLKTYLFPASFGMFAFFDVGKVSAPAPYDKGSTGTGYGGGFWIAPLNKLLISVSYAVSKEDKIPLFGFGWKF